MNNLEKRIWVYLQSPKTYCISGCSCGNEDTQWSEYADHLWCAQCEKDFIPEDKGILDGPFLLNVSYNMGMSFSRLNLQTNIIEVLDSAGEYVTCYNFADIVQGNVMAVILRDIMRENIGTANLNYKTYQLENIVSKESDISFFSTEVMFNFPQKDTFILTWENVNGQYAMHHNQQSENFKAYVMKNHLEQELDLKNNSKSTKI